MPIMQEKQQIFQSDLIVAGDGDALHLVEGVLNYSPFAIRFHNVASDG
jgi:hypothetical protein